MVGRTAAGEAASSPRPPEAGARRARLYAALSAAENRNRQTMAAITNAATADRITPGAAAELARVVEIFVRAVETSDFERRLEELEQRTKPREPSFRYDS